MPDRLPTPNPSVDPREPDAKPQDAPDDQEILNVLASYRSEAEQARKSGMNPRDAVWEANWSLYWGRFDFSRKAEWQSRHVPPEAPQFVDRWAAALREALMQAGRWFRVDDPADQSRDLVPHVEKFMEVLLARSGRNFQGHVVDFESTFEEQMKLGAIMALCASVTWQQDADGGYVAVDTVDPREVWFDPTGRNLYRRRKTEMDAHELVKLAEETDDAGEPLYRKDEILRLAAQIDNERLKNREQATGHGGEQSSTRKPIQIEEWLATVVLPDGTVAGTHSLAIVANDRFIIRGPEQNPFWHRRDWIVFAPMITVPLSVYGRSYMEDWADVARAFVEMTNLILDGTFTSTLNAFAANVEMLEDPTELDEGVSPNKVFSVEGRAEDFMKEIELGRLPAESIKVWEALKAEMREGAKLSEISLGQVTPKGSVTATEASLATQSGSAVIRSMARTIEGRFLEPVLGLVWATGLQHTDFEDPQMVTELGEDTARMLQTRKEEFRGRRIKFRVRALSMLIAQQQLLSRLLALLQTIGSSELLLQEFLKKHDLSKLIDELVRLFGIDELDLRPSEREQMIRGIVGQLEQARAAATGQAPAEGPQAPRQTAESGAM